MKHSVKITGIHKITHDVLEIRTEKPEGFEFTPGQATEVFVQKPGWENEGRPFTFTCLTNDNYLEFNTKVYPERKGVTNELLSLKEGDSLILNDIFGEIAYKGEGVFLAGGAGITPFIAILRELRVEGKLGNNKLIFANKTKADILHEDEFKGMLGNNFINILSDENAEGYDHGYVDESFLKQHISDFSCWFYLCGPPPMMDAVRELLFRLGVQKDKLVEEAF